MEMSGDLRYARETMTERHEHLVLLVDDQEEARDALAMLLKNEGFAVREASDGQEALDALYDGPRPCLVVLDLMMPGMDGWEFRRRQLRSPLFARIPTVVLSGHANLSAAATGLSAHEVLAKPVILGRLLELVRDYCPRR
jgi:CheY-like chemotaxis protein